MVITSESVIFSLILFLFPVIAESQPSSSTDSVLYRQQDVLIFNKVKASIHVKKHKNQITAIGLFFLNTPYVAHTLEGDKERLHVNLSELDCTTFLENVVVLNRTLISKKANFKTFCDSLKAFRYRNGVINGYGSRLHYFTDWIAENEAKGRVKDLTHDIGGVPYLKKISYMSEHPDAYPALKDSVAMTMIQKAEATINQRAKYYLPKTDIANAEEQIKDGDLIAFVPRLNGLDITHVGFAFRQKGRIYFLNASSLKKKVVISDLPLAEQLADSKNIVGIMVIRAVNP